MARSSSTTTSRSSRPPSSKLGQSSLGSGAARRGRRKAPAPVWLIAAAAASAVLLAIAHGFETFGHLPPCELCLHQREGYWIALTVALVGVAASRVWRGAPRAFALLLGLIFLGEAALAAYHAGVEWHWWPGPASCTGGHGVVKPSDMLALLKGVKIAVVQCDQAAWRFLGLSMAGWNAAVALVLALASLFVAATSGTRGLRTKS
jgi:disulfide bond formation protein DsbB